MKTPLAVTASLLCFCHVTFSQITQQWQSRFNGKGDYSDQINNVLVDNHGNIYLSGSTVNPSQNLDILTIKLKSTGDTLWKRTFDGSGHGADEGLDMAIDTLGNVYVTGYERGANGTGKNYLTIKYKANGDTAWVRSYSFSSNENEQANSIAVDNSGNVIVTGQSDNDPTTLVNDDYATVKYTSTGSLAWVARYNGNGNARDRAVKVVVDKVGNVFITGRSASVNNDDYVSIKYNATGAQQWLKIFDGGFTDRATDMAIDAVGDIYVTGRSSNGTNPDIVTVKYTNAGTESWSAIYDRVDYDIPTAIVLDKSGNIFVTGQSDADASTLFNYDYITLKYNSAGKQQWASLYNNVGNDDVASDLKVDAAGNVYVTGTSDANATALVSTDYATVKYNSAGVQQWAKIYNGTASSNDEANSLALTPASEVLVVGRSQTISQFDGFVQLYDETGNKKWAYTFTGVGDNTDYANDMTIDPSGNIIVVGSTANIGTDHNMSIVKLKPNGDTLWTREVTGTFSGSTDEATAVIVDASGFIYVTGYTINSYTSSDYTTIKYTPNGDTLWLRKYNYINESDRAFSIGLDASGGVYVTGRSDADVSLGTNYDIVTIKYSATGVEQWVRRFNGTANLDDYATILKVGATKVVVAGRTNNGANDDALAIAYALDGTLAWTDVYNGGTGDDRFSGLAIDNQENVFVTGRTFNGTDFDYLTTTFSPSGVKGWTVKYDGVGRGDDRAVALSLDHNGNVVVTGQSDSDPSVLTINFDYVTIQYSSSGVQKWVSNFNGKDNKDDIPSAIGVDDQNNVFVTGLTGIGLSSDYATVFYTYGGTEGGNAYYNGTANGQDAASTLAVGKNKTLYVSGLSRGTNSQADALTLSYSFQFLGLENENTGFHALISPNPFQHETTIDFSGAGWNGPSTFQLYTLEGRELKRLSVLQTDKLVLKKEELLPGTYLFKLSNSDQASFTGKLIVQ